MRTPRRSRAGSRRSIPFAPAAARPAEHRVAAGIDREVVDADAEWGCRGARRRSREPAAQFATSKTGPVVIGRRDVTSAVDADEDGVWLTPEHECDRRRPGPACALARQDEAAAAALVPPGRAGVADAPRVETAGRVADVDAEGRSERPLPGRGARRSRRRSARPERRSRRARPSRCGLGSCEDATDRARPLQRPRPRTPRAARSCRAAGWPRRDASGSGRADPPAAARRRRSSCPTGSGRSGTPSRRARGAAP